MDTVLGHRGLKAGRTHISVNNTRLKRALKKLLYFSEFFPKQYYQEFQQELGASGSTHTYDQLSKKLPKESDIRLKEQRFQKPTIELEQKEASYHLGFEDDQLRKEKGADKIWDKFDELYQEKFID